jgi:hypothetical protein
MRNRTQRRVSRIAIAAIAALALTACSSGQGGSGAGGGPSQVGSDGATNIGGSVLQTQIDALPTATLTAAEGAGLLRMREEEKLAHDVYVALNDKWHLQVFTNISAAEQTHTDAVKILLDRYSLDDPAAGNAAGVFTNSDLQSLYTTLVDQGSGSQIAALTAGATIEDLDIADLQSLVTTTPDISLVYSNLEKGSRNHLRAFTKQLTNSGATYTPAHITQTAYDAIIAGAVERGPGG